MRVLLVRRDVPSARIVQFPLYVQATRNVQVRLALGFGAGRAHIRGSSERARFICRTSDRSMLSEQQQRPMVIRVSLVRSKRPFLLLPGELHIGIWLGRGAVHKRKTEAGISVRPIQLNSAFEAHASDGQLAHAKMTSAKSGANT